MNTLSEGETFTKFPNTLLEALASADLTKTQFKILMVIIRHTYGFHKQCGNLSLNFLSSKTGGIDRNNIQKNLKELECKNIIMQDIKNWSYRIIKLNKNTEQWFCNPKSQDNTSVVSMNHTCTNKNNDSSVVETNHSSVGNSNHSGVGDTNHTTVGTTNHHIRNIKDTTKDINKRERGQSKSETFNDSRKGTKKSGTGERGKEFFGY